MKTVKRNVRSRKTLKRKYKGGSGGAAPRKPSMSRVSNHSMSRPSSRSKGRPSTHRLSAAQAAMRTNLPPEYRAVLNNVIDLISPRIGDNERNALIGKISRRITPAVMADFSYILDRIRLQTNPNGSVSGAGIVAGSIKDLTDIISDLKR
jgi:hypothetical protein